MADRRPGSLLIAQRHYRADSRGQNRQDLEVRETVEVLAAVPTNPSRRPPSMQIAAWGFGPELTKGMRADTEPTAPADLPTAVLSMRATRMAIYNHVLRVRQGEEWRVIERYECKADRRS